VKLALDTVIVGKRRWSVRCSKAEQLLSPVTLKGTMSHDSQLQQAVLAELSWEPSVTAAHIGVTNAGVVTLAGHVESFVEKHAAETATRLVRDVQALAEEIEARHPFYALREPLFVRTNCFPVGAPVAKAALGAMPTRSARADQDTRRAGPA
jgi:hypothetical protein